MLEDANIIVIGGAGFIGSHLVDLLLKQPVASICVYDNFYRGKRENLESAVRDPRVLVVEADILDRETLNRHVAGRDYVFHLAAAWLLECLEKPRLAIDYNITGTFNVLEACRDSGVKKLVYSSSASVYGNALAIPMTEEHPYNNRTLYGATKIAGEQLCRAFNEMYGLDYVGLRYMNVYGPRQDYRGAYVVVIMKILDRLDQGLAPLIFGDGTQTYDFIHVTDVARANLLALESRASDSCYNVGCGKGTSLNQLTDLLLELTGSSLRPEYLPQGQTFVTQRIGSTEAAVRDLGFTSTVDLRAGLETLIEWRRGHKEQSLKVSEPATGVTA